MITNEITIINNNKILFKYILKPGIFTSINIYKQGTEVTLNINGTFISLLDFILNESKDREITEYIITEYTCYLVIESEIYKLRLFHDSEKEENIFELTNKSETENIKESIGSDINDLNEFIDTITTHIQNIFIKTIVF